MDVIVVASSEQGIQETLRVLLGEKHLLVCAGTLPELLSALVERPVDIVIIDEFLENIDCVSVFQRLKALAPDTTCILLALQTNSEMAREMRARGIYDIVAKPFDKDALLGSVSRALERSHLMQRLEAAHGAAAQPPAPRVLPPAGSGEPSPGQRREMLDSLRKFLKAITDVFEPERLYNLVLEAVVEMFSINRAVLLLHHTETGQMRIKAAVGLDPALLGDYRVAPWTGIISWVRKHDRILDLDDPDGQINLEDTLAIRKELELLQTRMCVPLVLAGRLIGVLAIGKKVTGKRISDAEIEFLCLLSQQIAAIIENARRHRAVFVQKEKFEEILQGVTSGLMATDSEGRLIVFNKAAEQILKLDASEVLGQSVQRTGSIFADIIFRALRGEESFCRHEIVDPATKAHLGISTSLLTDSDGKPVGVVMLFADLSTVSLRGAGTVDEMWQRCALCLAQEIKNPLVAIRTFTQLFPESYADEKFRNEFSKIAIKEIDRLDNTVERLMRFAQPLEIKAEPQDIHSLLEEEIGRMADTAKAQDVKLERNFQIANGNISFDRNLLQEAFEQIFHNALEAMPSGGSLTVSTATAVNHDSRSSTEDNGIPTGEVAEISIADTGVGIAPEEMPNLFKPFHTSKVKGMGLGLPISRRIVRGHRGEIVVSSEPNKGTTVKVVLPYGAA